MEIVGKWEGSLFFETLREYVADEPIGLDIKTIDGSGNVIATITEKKGQKGFQREAGEEEVEFVVRGIYDPVLEKLLLTGNKPIGSQRNKEPIEIVGRFAQKREIFTGHYTQSGFSKLTAEIELYRVGSPPSVDISQEQGD